MKLRVRGFSGDEEGSVLLLSGMMMFVVTIFALTTINISESYYKKIQVQVAVDAAAESAALWQARGLNLAQHVNNLHYKVNAIAAVSEILTCCSGCILQFIPWTAAAGKALCKVCPYIDQAQQKFAEVVNIVHEVIDVLFPIITFLNANEHARVNGADEIGLAAQDYFQEAFSEIQFLDTLLNNGLVSGLLNLVGSLPVYAVPLDPTSILLDLTKKNGEHFPYDLGAGNTVLAVCGTCCTALNGGDPGDDWGWDDDWRYAGVGYMTWMAGIRTGARSTGEKELTGIGHMDWFRPNGRKEMIIPPVMGFASSQAEPGMVKAGINEDFSQATLIPVQLPLINKPASYLGIFH
jgi:hypothetical protein